MFAMMLFVVVLLIVSVLTAAAARPDTFRVERSIAINAPAAKIFDLIDDFHRWNEWSPYEDLDPEMKRTFGDTPSGVGATYAWEGDGKVGAGRMEIRESVPPSHIAIQLDFTRPFKSSNIAEFTLTPHGEATEVTWAMHGPSSYISRLMGLFFNLDKTVGEGFETGLANMKEAVEATPG